MSDKDIATSIMDHFDSARYGISVHTVRRRRKDWGLQSTRRQSHTVQSIAAFVDDIKKRFPNRGAETIRKALLLENKIRVPRPIIAEYLRQTEPDAVEARRYKRFKRRTFIAIGPNEMWSLDQHDKFKRFGLFFHVGLDPFPGNPKLITRFYLDTARSIGGIPLITQSDPGTENVNLRHQVDPSLDGSIQHRWFRKHGNIKPEIHWSVFRRDWAVGFQNLLDEGVENKYYDIGDPLEWHAIFLSTLVFRFVFIPFIQREVDAWVHQRNWTKLVLPNGIPMIILQKPHKWKAADYKIPVPPEVLNEIEKKYAPPDDPVFELVPPEFAVHANAVWTTLGCPQPQFDNAWGIYLQIRDALRGVAQDGALVRVLSSVPATSEPQHCLDEIPMDLEPIDEDELLIVENSDDEGDTLVIDATEDEGDSEAFSEGAGIGLDFL
ncbi:hypothetical protein EDB84DRAFT_1590323 [Lactarius hengduanensis]|nr:hypothetical protein EDB84DRAFT_1590323 [Lactarius hengduanensis]